MDKLFEQFYQQQLQLAKYFDLAPTQSKPNTGPSQRDIDGCHAYANKIRQYANEIQRMINQGFDENKKSIDAKLSFYRSLSKELDYKLDYYWSAYYPQITESIRNIYKVRRDIDIKYKLGQHKNDP